MERFIRFYNQNRKAIYKWIAIIAIAYLFLRLINSFIEEKSKKDMSAYMENVTNNNNLVNEVVLNNTTSSTNTKAEKYGNVLDDFLEYCKKQESYENAYELLSEQAKQKEDYSTKELFTQNFINKFFNNNSQYVINELNNIYVIEIYVNDILQTGNTDEIKRQYIIIDNDKINIQDYIKSYDINKKVTKDNVIYNIKNVTYYYDNAQYKIYITNSGQETLNIKNIYLQLAKTKIDGQPKNNIITIQAYESKILNLKFNVKYKQVNTIKNMTMEIENDKIELEL